MENELEIELQLKRYEDFIKSNYIFEENFADYCVYWNKKYEINTDNSNKMED